MQIVKKNLKSLFLSFLLIINIGIFYAIWYQTDSKLTVSFLDVGQGDAIFIKTPDGKQILIDGGANNSILRELGKVMPFFDRSIDVVLATHTDQDHIGGLVEVLRRFEIDLLIQTNSTSSSAVYQKFTSLIKEKSILEKIIVQPEIITLGKDLEFYILFPNHDVVGWEPNEASIVSKLRYGKNSFLFTGDAPQIIEKYLVNKYGDFLDSDVLKVGHHGSKTSSLDIFVGTVSPDYSIISAGLNNRYGHPHSEVLENLAQFSGNILKTFDSGRIVLESDGESLLLKK